MILIRTSTVLINIKSLTGSACQFSGSVILHNVILFRGEAVRSTYQGAGSLGVRGLGEGNMTALAELHLLLRLGLMIKRASPPLLHPPCTHPL